MREVFGGKDRPTCKSGLRAPSNLRLLFHPWYPSVVASDCSFPTKAQKRVDTRGYPRILLPLLRKMPWNIISSAWALVAFSRAASRVTLLTLTRS